MAADALKDLLSPCQACDRVHILSTTNAGYDSGAPRQEAVAALTSQEYEVFTRMAAAWSNRQLADALFVTDYTIKAHVTKIRRKLNAGTREQIVVAAHVHNAWRCATEHSANGK